MDEPNIGLMNLSTQQPNAPESNPEPESEHSNEESTYNENVSTETDKTDKTDITDSQGSESEHSNEPEQQEEEHEDDYGIKQPKAKEERTYTENEVKERIRHAIEERIERFKSNQGQEQATQQATQEAKKNFEYDSESSESWQEQLEGFIENTLTKINQRQQQQSVQQMEQQAQAEFKQKFATSAKRYNDFEDVVADMPFNEIMVNATRGLDDPAAFIYAASKNQPEEVKRISQISDPYKQIVEIGRLEQRMRKNKTVTKAPKPVSRTNEDAYTAQHQEKPKTIDDLIVEDQKRRLEVLNRRRGR